MKYKHYKLSTTVLDSLQIPGITYLIIFKVIFLIIRHKRLSALLLVGHIHTTGHHSRTTFSCIEFEPVSPCSL